MNAPFEDFDPSDITNADKELSVSEKAIIMALRLLAKGILWKVKRAKTYGDLYKLVNLIEDKVQVMGDNLDNIDPETPIEEEEAVRIVEEELEKLTKDVKEG